MSGKELKKFSFDTIDDFDTHISTSIPNYLSIQEMILNMSDYFIESGTNIYDLGCSKGTLLEKIRDKNDKKDTVYYGYDISENLLPDSKKNLIYLHKNLIKDSTELFNNASLMLSIFTMQFLPKKNRLDVLKNVYNNLNKGGALVMCEKVYAENSNIQDINTFLYYDFKKRTYTNDEILSKETDLRSIMKPLTYEENVNMLKEAGFKNTECFYRFYNFAGLLCIK